MIWTGHQCTLNRLNAKMRHQNIRKNNHLYWSVNILLTMFTTMTDFYREWKIIVMAVNKHSWWLVTSAKVQQVQQNTVQSPHRRRNKKTSEQSLWGDVWKVRDKHKQNYDSMQRSWSSRTYIWLLFHIWAQFQCELWLEHELAVGNTYQNMAKSVSLCLNSQKYLKKIRDLIRK